MPVTEIENIEELKKNVGKEIAVSDWTEITQDQINMFADATGDHQWIHIDAERCRTESQFGTTIAHGFLTLSMIPKLATTAVRMKQKFKMGINYGLNKVRFVSPVPVNSKIRSRLKLLDVKDVEGGYTVNYEVTIEREGADKPAAVAETLSRLVL